MNEMELYEAGLLAAGAIGASFILSAGCEIIEKTVDKYLSQRRHYMWETNNVQLNLFPENVEKPYFIKILKQETVEAGRELINIFIPRRNKNKSLDDNLD